MLGLFVSRDVGLVFERKPDIVQTFEQDMLSKRVDFKFVVNPCRSLMV